MKAILLGQNGVARKYAIKRLVVDDGNLVITVLPGELSVHSNPEIIQTRQEWGGSLLGEVEVPDELIVKALEALRVNNELNSMLSMVEAIVNPR